MEENYQLIDNKAHQQFELDIKGYTPLIEYYINPEGNVFLTHTEVPMQLEGKGIGSTLVKKTLENIEQRKLHVVPMCPFVAAYIKKHPEWMRIVVK